MATCGDALAPTRAAARTERLESLLRAHLARLATHPGDLPVRREARAIARELKRRGDPGVNRGLAVTAHARAALLALDEADPARTLEACEAVLVLDPDQATALRLLARAASSAGLMHVVGWVQEDLRALEGHNDPAGDLRVAALVGESALMRRARAWLSAALDSEAPVLLLGEAGTGKRLAAEVLHAGGRAPRAPFQVLGAALPEATLERKLFGAGNDAGALEQPGTLLITEAHLLPPILQARLARAVRTREVQRSGDCTPRGAAVPRLVLATPPLARPWPGPFVVDGLARLLVPIELPSLRERPEDLGPLAAHLLRGTRSKGGRPLRLRAAALQAFERHTWPGNVDELAGALRDLVKQHRWRQLARPERVLAERAHPVESVHAALTAALDHLFDSVADERASPPSPARAALPPRDDLLPRAALPRRDDLPPRDDIVDRLVAGLTAQDAGGLAHGLVAAAERLGARWAALWRVDEAGRAHVLQLGDRALADPASARAQVFEPAPPGSMVARAATDRRTVVTLIAAASELDLLKVLSAGGLAPRTLLTSPVLRGDRAIGVLLVADPVGGEFFTYPDLRALEALAAGVARGVSERGLDRLPGLPRPVPSPAPREAGALAEPPVGWGPLPARPARLRAPRFTHEGVAAAVSAAVVFTGLMLGATYLLGP